jgi:hypothetical protein
MTARFQKMTASFPYITYSQRNPQKTISKLSKNREKTPLKSVKKSARFRYMTAKFGWATARFRYMTTRFHYLTARFHYIIARFR